VRSLHTCRVGHSCRDAIRLVSYSGRQVFASLAKGYIFVLETLLLVT